MPRTLWTLPLLLLSFAAADAQAGGVDADVVALEKQVALELEGLAGWCQTKKLYGTRDEILEQLLAYDADHRKARKRLKFKQDESGAWVRSGAYRRPRNMSKRGLDEVPGKLETIMAGHRERLVAVCTRETSIAGLLRARQVIATAAGRWPAAQDLLDAERALALRYYAAVRDKGLVKEMNDVAAWLRERHPTDLVVRSALGEVKHGEAWVLEETARTLDGAAGLDEVLAAARKAVEVKPAEQRKIEAKIELPWTAGVNAKHVRVAGTAEAKEVADLATACDAAGALFEAALGAAPSRRHGLVIYVFATKGEMATFLDGYPVVANPTLALRDKLDLVYADGQALAIKANPPNAQKDLAVNEVLNQIFADTFLKSAAPRGWHAEGISRYLAWKLTGTRLSINVSGKYAGQAGDRHVPETNDPWLQKARGHLGKDGKAGLELLMGKGTDVFTVRDSMIAYAFAIYLIEGFDGVAGQFVKSHAETKDADRTCRELLGMPRAVAEQRLARWLDEVIAAQKSNR